jgi:hypothetical protein
MVEPQQNGRSDDKGIDEQRDEENEGDEEEAEAEDRARRLEAEKKELARLEKGPSRLPPRRPSLTVATNTATSSYVGTSAAATSQKRVKFNFNYYILLTTFFRVTLAIVS